MTVWRWRGALLMALLSSLCNTTPPVPTSAATPGAPNCQDVSIPVTVDLVPAAIDGVGRPPAEPARRVDQCFTGRDTTLELLPTTETQMPQPSPVVLATHQTHEEDAQQAVSR